MYKEKFPSRGQPATRKRHLQDLLRLTLGAVESVSMRREVLDATNTPRALPANVQKYKHAVYETSVIYEFSQLARRDFEAHGNSYVWERPLVWSVPGRKYLRSGHIDLALFSEDRDVETRIEFGKAAGTNRSKHDIKLQDDALKLFEARNDYRASKNETAPGIGLGSTENFVILWNETFSALTERSMAAWNRRCDTHAQSASRKVNATVPANAGRTRVVSECSAAASLTTFKANKHRTAYAVIYCVQY